MKVIFIAGTSHSGSTLLDLMLNAHPEIVSVGEVVNLPRVLKYKNPQRKTFRCCSCGARSFWACEFWSCVNRRMQERSGKSLATLDLQDRSRPGTLDSALFRAISEASGKNLIVDSSKLPSRLASLLRVPGLEIYPIHLIRNPNGHIYSMNKKHGGFIRHILRYEFVHAQIRRLLKSVPHRVVNYEDLVLQPEKTLRGILEPLGLAFDLRQLAWAEQVKHVVPGNRIRRQQESKLVLDEKWKTSFTSVQKKLISIGTLPSRALRRNHVTGQ
jgi:hypothetical protein